MNYLLKLNRQQMLGLSVLLLTMLISPASQARDFLEDEKGDSLLGAQVWANNCSRCHNMRDPQDLRDDQWITTVFHMRIRAGLTGQQTRDILEFLQTANNPSAAVLDTGSRSNSASTASGSDIYNRSCIACHGGDGKGTVPGAPDFNNTTGPLSQSDEVLFQHIRDGFKSPGSVMAMPPRGGDSSLTDGDIQAALDHLRENFGQ